MTDYAPLLAALRAEQDVVSCDSRHVYRRGGQYQPGVTTVCKVMDAPRLDDWKVRVQVEGTARAAHANPPVFGEALDDYVARLVKLGRAEYEHQRLADAAANLGNEVHLLVAFAIRSMLGEPCELPDVSEEAHFVFAGWREWAQEVGFQPIATEARVSNREHVYCGTFDALAEVGGRLTVVDWKPKDALYPERRLQLTAYARALHSMGWPEMDRAVVSLPRDGGSIRLVPLDDDPEDTFRSFLACLTLHRWQAKLRNGAKKEAAA